MNIKYFAISFFLLAASFSVQANPLKTVGTGIVNKGQHTIELRSAWSADNEKASDDGRFQTREFYDYGVTDWYAFRVTAIQDNAGMDDYEHNAMMWDNRVQLFERRDHGFDGGFRFSYTLRDGDKKPDILEARWIDHFYFGAYEFRHHIMLQQQVGEDSEGGLMPELRWQLTRETFGKHRAGLEMFNEFGNLQKNTGFDRQAHDAGVVFTGPIGRGFRYQAGYRHGLSENAPDHAVKFFIGYDF